MTTKVEKSIQVDVPLTTAYNQWTQFEDFPHFMGGVKEVRQLDDRRLHWVAEIAGVRRRVGGLDPGAGARTRRSPGRPRAGRPTPAPSGSSRPARSTIVSLTLEYEPEGVVEQVGDKLGIVERQVTSDLERFKKLIEEPGLRQRRVARRVNEGVGVGTPGRGARARPRGTAARPGSRASRSRPVRSPRRPAWRPPRRRRRSPRAARRRHESGGSPTAGGPHVVDTVEVVETNQPMDEWGED